MSASPSENQPKSRPATGLVTSPEELDKPWHKVFIRTGGAIARLLFAIFFHLQVEGQANVPRKGPLLLTINHLSIMDIPTLGSALIALGWEPGVNMFTVAKQELFEKPFLLRLMSVLGMFPIHRNQMDVNAMRTMLTIFKRGALLGMAPEGARSPTGHLQLFQPVVAKLAIQKRLPILPVGLVGVERVLPIGARFPRPVPVSIHFGKVYELTAYYDQALTPEVLERAAWEMRARVAELLPEWMRELPPEDAVARFGTVRSAEPIVKHAAGA